MKFFCVLLLLSLATFHGITSRTENPPLLPESKELEIRKKQELQHFETETDVNPASDSHEIKIRDVESRKFIIMDQKRPRSKHHRKPYRNRRKHLRRRMLRRGSKNRHRKIHGIKKPFGRKRYRSKHPRKIVKQLRKTKGHGRRRSRKHRVKLNQSRKQERRKHRRHHLKHMRASSNKPRKSGFRPKKVIKSGIKMVKGTHPGQKLNQYHSKVNSKKLQNSHRTVPHAALPQRKKMMKSASPVTNSSNVTNEPIVDDQQGCDSLEVVIFTDEVTVIIDDMITPKFNRSTNEEWYKFLDELYSKLSEYDIQKAVCKYNVENLEDWGSVDKPQGIRINDENEKKFFEIISSFDLVNQKSFEKNKLTDMQVEELNHILNITLNYKTSILCLQGTNNSMVIRGNYIRLSGLDFNVCSQKNKFIKIYALDTVFIDEDFEVKVLTDVISLHILAPKWSIIGQRKIRLVGANQTFVYKNDLKEGASGSPGLPGQPGGNFFGFGNEFLNMENLTVDVSGGNGGRGQNGGDGINGKDGPTVYKPNLYPPPSSLCDTEKDVFTAQATDYHYYNFICSRRLITAWSGNSLAGKNCKKIEWNSQCLSAWWNFWLCSAIGCCEYFVNGVPGEKGKDGGNGGAGGIPGSEGNILLANPHNINFTSIKRHGNKGRPGNGGNGGEGGRTLYSTWYVCNSFKSANWIENDEIREREQSPSGKKGKKGGNQKSIQDPASPEAIYLTSVFVDYKIYLIENAYDRYRRPFLKKYVDLIEVITIDLMSAEDLCAELQTLEEKFYILNTKIDFLPFYQSLLNRIEIFAETTEDQGEKKAMNYLFVATISKINSFNPDTVLIKNVNEYFRILIENFKSLQTLKKDSDKLKSVVNKIHKIDSEKKNYVESINLLIKEGRILVEDQIFPEFDRIERQLKDSLKWLTSEVNHEKAKLIQEKADLEKKRAEMIFWAPFQIYFSVLKNIAAPLASILIGPAAGAAVKAGAELGKSLTKVKPLKTRKLGMLKSITKADSQLNKIKRVKIKEMYLIGKFAEKYSIDFDSKAFINKMSDGKSLRALDAILDNGKKTAANAIKVFPDIPEVFSKNLAAVITDGAGAWGVGVDIINEVNAINEIGKAIRQKQEQIDAVKAFEKRIEKEIEPMFEEIVKDVKQAAGSLESKSLMTLDVTKYEVRKVIHQLKFEMKKLTEGFKASEEIAESLNNLEDAFTIIITLYDRIQGYMESQKFATYIADLMTAVASDMPIPTRLEVHMSYLEVLISSNLIKQQLKTAFDSIKQFVFPLAHMYFSNFAMPSSLKLETSIENLAFESFKQVSFIKSQLDEYNYAIKEYDGAFATGWFNSQYDDSKPFFTWNNQEHKFAISQILSGKETVLRANLITSATRFDAVKFKNINIKVKLRNARSQKKLDKILKGFSVSLIHMGDSYFRFRNKLYLIHTNSLELWFSYEVTSEGDPVFKNEVYRKLNNGDFMLSPFATWQMKLSVIPDNKNNFTLEHLEKYKDEVDLDLVGIGFFLRPDKIPNDKKLFVSSYYKPVEHMFTAKTKREVEEEKSFNCDSWCIESTRSNDTFTTFSW